MLLWVGSTHSAEFWRSWPYFILGVALMSAAGLWAYWSRSRLGTLVLMLATLLSFYIVLATLLALVFARISGLESFTMYFAGSSIALGVIGFVFRPFLDRNNP